MCAPSCNAIDEPAAGIGCDSGRPGPRPAGAPAGVQNRSRDFVELKLRLAERVRLTRAVLALALRAPLRASKIAPAILSNPLRLAERVRFELTSPVRGCPFSRPVHSTALPPLRSVLNQLLAVHSRYLLSPFLESRAQRNRRPHLTGLVGIVM